MSRPFAPRSVKTRLAVGGGHEAAPLVEPLGVPLFWDSVADEGEARGAQGDQFIGVDGDVARSFAAEGGIGSAVFEEVAAHPVVFAAGEALDRLAEVAPERCRAALSRRADQRHREPLVEGHRHQRGFAKARDALDADVLGVDGGVGFEVIESASGAPGPGTERAPVLGLARAAVIDEPDDAAAKTGSVIGLHTGGVEEDKAPAVGDELPGVRRPSVFVELRKLKGSCLHRLPGGVIGEDIFQGGVLLNNERFPRGVDAVEFVGAWLVRRRKAGAAEHHEHRNRAFGTGGKDQRHVDLHFDGWKGRIVHFADEVFGDHRVEADHLMVDGREGPSHFGHIGRDSPIDFLFEQLDDFGAALVPPEFGRRHFFSVVERERIGKIGVGICFRLVVVGVAARLLIAARARAQGFDAELVHHVLVVLVGGDGDGRVWSLGGRGRGR